MQITVVGNIGRDAEQKVTRNGKIFTTFSVAHTPRVKKDGEWVDGETVWFKVTSWNNLPEIMLTQGSRVIVTGDFKQESYEKDGQTRSVNSLTAEAVGILVSPVREVEPAREWPTQTADDGWAVVSDDTPF